MSSEEFQSSEHFKRDSIQPRIMQDWLADDASLLHEWLCFAERFRPTKQVNSLFLCVTTEHCPTFVHLDINIPCIVSSLQVAAMWQDLFEEEIDYAAQVEQRLQPTRHRRIGETLSSIRNPPANDSEYARGVGTNDRRGRDGRDRDQRLSPYAGSTVRYSHVLPERFSTEVVSFFISKIHDLKFLLTPCSYVFARRSTSTSFPAWWWSAQCVPSPATFCTSYSRTPLQDPR